MHRSPGARQPAIGICPLRSAGAGFGVASPRAELVRAVVLALLRQIPVVVGRAERRDRPHLDAPVDAPVLLGRVLLYGDTSRSRDGAVRPADLGVGAGR